MPQSITIDLPLVIEGEVGNWLVRPVGFPEFSLASSSVDIAIRNAKRRVAKLCAKYIGSDLIARLVRGEVRQSEVVIEFVPPKKSEQNAQWREPLSVSFATFAWSQDDSLVVTYVPQLDLTIVASPGTDVAKLVQEQIRSAVRRLDAWSLKQLAVFGCEVQTELQHERLKIELPTPAEWARQTSDLPKSKTPTLQTVATRLKRKSLPQVYHRDDLVELFAQMLSGDQARSVLLVGPSGVGKTAIFHQWVRTRDRWDMKHVQCWATDGSRLISGQCGFGMWQKQCLAMADEAAKYPSVIHLGNLVELSESGRMRGSGGCGSLLAPRLADGSLIGVIECTPEQLTRMQRMEPRLVAALTTLTIEEPTPEENRSILLEAATAWRPVDVSADLKRKRREKQKRASQRLDRASSTASVRRNKKSPPSPAPLPIVLPEALQVLDRLHRRFKTDAASPGRSLAFFETVMSEMRPGETLDLAKVHAAFGRQTGLPSFLIDDNVRPDLEQIQQQLQSQVLGQDEVVTTLVDVIATMAADLSRGDRPLASLMMIGPTGVGKTETAKALARLIYSDVSRLVRIDMSELSSPTAVGRLIGDSVHGEGLLTAAVRAQPFSLVLLDEFEKAHPSVFDLLLQVLGEGRLTDGRGRVADFRNSIVMMTSNLGVESFRASPMGLADTNPEFRYRDHFEKQIREFLRPEMFNRIDRILSYAPLSPHTVGQIAQLQLNNVQKLDGWKHQGSEFAVDAGVAELLANNGYEPQFGARPLNREIQKSVLVPLANAICDIGRHHRVDVSLQVAGGGDKPSRIAVKAKAAPVKNRRQRDKLAWLVDEVTLLRRRGQALERCSALTKLRNRFTTSRRSLRRKIASAKNQNEKEAIRFSVRARHCSELRDQIRAVEKLAGDLRRAESRLLCRIHANESIDVAACDASIGKLKDRLWELLCELHSQRDAANQRISLILLGPRLDLATSLLAGYGQIAKKRSWNLQAHALLPRDHDGTDRVIDADGWSSEPSFRVATESLENNVDDLLREMEGKTWGVESVSAEMMMKEFYGGIPASQSDPEAVALGAYGLINLSRLTFLPSGTLGLMITFGGHAAEMWMAGEVGVHTFSGLDQKKSLQHSILINKHLGTPIQYKAPDWLPERKFEMTGHPRRGYDMTKGMVLELSDDDARSLKMDREGRWLEQVLEQEMERRIWSTLEDDEPDSPATPKWF
ncbi:MAG: AAA family ATPase [Pirellulaceae bacterium]